MRKFITDILAKTNLGVEQNAYVLGTVGIGTSTPSYKLHVDGTIYGPTYTSGSITINSGDFLFSAEGGGDGFQMDYYNGQMYFGNNAGTSWHMVMQDSGNIGIGTTSPSQKLVVIGNAAISGVVYTDYVQTYSGTSIDFRHQDASVVMRVDTANAAVGIGTTSPAAKLDVIGKGVFGTMASSRGAYSNGLSLQNNTGELTSLFLWQSGVASAHIGSPANSTSLHIVNSYNTGLITDPNSIVLTNTGNVGIGTTTPNARLTVVANDSSNPNVALRLSSTGYSGVPYPHTSIRFGSAYSSYPSWNLASIDAGYTGSSWGGSLLFYTNNDSVETNLTERMRITTGGSLLIGSTTQAYNPQTQGYLFGVKSNTTQTFISIAKSGQTLDSGGMIVGLDSTTGYVWMRESTNLSFGTNNTARVTIAADGNVGIGTTSPSYKLHVAGDILSSGSFRLESGGATVTYISEGWGINLNGDSTHPVQVPNASLAVGYALGGGVNYGSGNMFVSGNVGIGTNNPGYKLDITGVTRFQDKVRFAINTWNLSDDGYNRLYFANGGRTYYGSGDGHEWRNASNATIAFLGNNGNFGLGTTNPGDPLHIVTSGSDKFIRIENTNLYTGLWLNDGGSNSGWLVLSGYTDTASPGDFAIREYGVQTSLTIKQTTGNVGIGTTGPSYKLHVAGDAYVSSNFTIGSTTNIAAAAWLQFNGSNVLLGEGTNTYLQANGGGSIIFRNNSPSELMRITNSGNIGIGTTGPVSPLDVNGIISSRGIFIAQNSGTYNLIYNASNSVAMYIGGSADPATYYDNLYHYFRSNSGSTTYGVWNSTGLGIGTVNPAQKLHVVGYAWINRPSNKVDNNGATEFGSRVEFNNNFASGQSGYMVFRYPSYNNFLIGGDYDGNIGGSIPNIQFGRSNGTVYVHIDANGGTGNVGIGTTSPSYKLDVYGDIRSGGNDPLLILQPNSGTYAFLQKLSSSNGNYLRLYDGTNYSTFWKDNKVGIGTASPAGKLSIEGDGTEYSNIVFKQSAAQEHLIYASANYQYNLIGSGAPVWIWGQQGGSERMRLDNNGLGIGTTSPAYKLDVNGETRLGKLITTWSNSPITPSAVIYSESGYNTVFAGNGQFSSSYLALMTTGNMSYMGGNVGIGVTAPGHKLAVDGRIGGATYSDSHIEFNSSGNTILKANNSVIIGYSSDTYITQGGNVGIGTNSPSYKLDVVGTVRLGGTEAQNYPIKMGRENNAVYMGGPNTNTINVAYDTDSDYNLHINYVGYVGSTTRYRNLVVNDGKQALIAHFDGASRNVGIGIASPSAPLHVYKSDTYSAIISRADWNIAETRLGLGAQYGVLGYISTGIVETVNDTTYVALNYKNGLSTYAEGLRVYNNGNVGIGTTSPSYKLQVESSTNASVAVAGASGYQTALELKGADQWYRLISQPSVSGNRFDIYNQTLGAFAFSIASNLDAYLYGNVGIGTNSPTAPLTFGKAVYGDPSYEDFYRIKFQDVGGVNNDIGIGQPASGSLGFNVAAFGYISFNEGTNGERVRIAAGGNVGIGTTSPPDQLSVGKSTGTSISITSNFAAGTIGSPLNLDLNFRGYADNKMAMIRSWDESSNTGNGYLTFWTNNPGVSFSEKMRITPKGSLLLGSSVTPDETGWYGTGVFGPNGNNKIILGYLGSATNGATIGAHNSALNSWADLNITGTTIIFRNLNQTETARITNAGNVGIGTTSPSKKLDVQGSISLGTGVGNEQGLYINVGNGTSDYSNIRFYHGGTNTQTIHSFSSTWQSGTIFSASTNAINIDGASGLTVGVWYDPDAVFVEGGTTYFKGNVGIGTTSPNHKLDVNAGFVDGSSGYVATFHSKSGSAGDTFVGIGSYRSDSLGSDRNAYINVVAPSGGTGSLGLQIAGGNVGIGTTSPSAKLTVLAASTGYSSDSQIKISDTTTSYYGGLSYDDAGSTRLSIRNSYDGTNSTIGFGFGGSADKVQIIDGTGLIINEGNVGIGTTSPSTKLHVVSTSTTELRLQNSDANNNYGFVKYETSIAGAGGNLVIGTNASGGGYGAIGFSNNNNVEFVGNGDLYIVKSGNVGIGTYSPLGKMTVFGDGGSNTYSGVLRIVNTNPSNAWGCICLPNDISTQSSANNYYLIGRTADVNNRIMSFHIPNASDYGSGVQPKFGFYSTGGDLLHSIEASTGKSYFKGAVGIGTASPSAKLHVVGGRTYLETENEIYTLGISRSGANAYYLGVSNALSPDLYFSNNAGTTRVTFTDAGNVGIGTTNPNQKLQVNGFVNATGYVNSGTTFIKSFNIGNISAGATFALGRLNFESVYTHHFRVTITSYYGSKTFDFIGYQTYLNKTVSGISGGGDVVIETILDAYTQVVGVKIGITTGVNDYVYTATVECLSTFSSWEDYSSTTTITPTSIGYTNSAFAIGGGNVGIGTTSPNEKLDVRGNIYLPQNNYIYFDNSGHYIRRGSSDVEIQGYNGIQLRTNSTTQVYINQSGYVGIGTTSPSQILHIYGGAPTPMIESTTVGANANLRFKTTARTWSIGPNQGLSNSFFEIYDSTAFATRVTIDTSGNVGIGTTSPSYKLDVNGTARVQSGLYVDENSVGAGSILRFIGGSSYYNFQIAKQYTVDGGLEITPSTAVGGSTYSTPALVVKANGNVGIGTTSPGYKLDVSGIINTTSSPGSYGTIIRIRDTVTSGTESFGGVHFTSSPGTDYTIGKWTTAAGVGLLQIRDQAGNQFVTINSSGNVGIGTTSPTNRLQIGSIGSSGYGGNDLAIGNGTQAMAFYQSSTVSTWYTNTSFSLMPSGSGSVGNVGIGTTSPSAKLEISGFSTGAGLKLNYGNSSGTIEAINFIANGGANGFIGMQMVSAGVGDLWLGGSGGRSLTLYRDGNVGIGTASPTERLEVNGSIRLSDGNADGPQLKLASSGYSDWNIDNYNGSLRAYYGGTEYTRLTSSGNFGIGTGSPSYKLHVEGNVSGISIYASHDIAAFSDITVKKEVERIENAVDKVKELNGYTYVRTDDATGTRRAGVIAQEVQKVLPEVVSQNPDGTLNVAYANMIALLIEAVKEQQKEIDELKRMLNK